MGDIPKHIPFLRRVLISWFRKTFARTYLNEYFKESPHKKEDLEQWMVPMIVERLADGIAEEQQALQELLQRGLGMRLLS